MLLHLTNQNEKEPRSKAEVTVGVTPEDWDPATSFVIDTKRKNILNTGMDKMSAHVGEKYYFQVVYKQNITDGNENVTGNLYSEVDSILLTRRTTLHLALQKMIPPLVIISHPFVKSVEIKSNYLADFFGNPRFIKAAILLPSGYFDHAGKIFPICYRAPGLNVRAIALNGMMNKKEFTDWWFYKDAPQVIYVFLDSQGPYGDTYQVDSENNGPCGKALTEELIPAIEKLVQYNPATKMRYLTGYSTGGWVALALQIFYPDFFDGTWSYSLDRLNLSITG